MRTFLATAWATSARLPVLCIALATFVWTIPLQWIDLWTRHQINGDVALYESYAGLIALGDIPYRDFAIEYPPGAAGLFWATWWIPGDYFTAFSALMLVSLCLCILGAICSARHLGFSPRRQAVIGCVIACTPLLLGSLVQARFDLAIAAILSWMFYAALTERWKWMWSLAAVGILIKLIPLALIPLLVVWQLRRRDLRSALIGAGSAISVAILAVVPFILLSPSGMWYMINYNARRPPQLETVIATVMLVAHTVANTPVEILGSFGSVNVVGTGPELAAKALFAVLVVLTLGCALQAARLLRTATATHAPDILVCAGAASVIGFTLTGKSLSPQYMVWLLPLTFLIAGRRGIVAIGCAIAAQILTQTYFPIHYWGLVNAHSREITLLAARNLILIVLLVVCWPRANRVAGAGLLAPPDTAQPTST